MNADGLFSLDTVEKYGLPLVLLLGAIYALYKFIFFSLIEVKNEFGRRHDANLQSMSQLHQEMAEMKSDLKLITEFVKDTMRKW